MAIIKWRGLGPAWFDDETWQKLMEWPTLTNTTGGLDIYETEDAVVVEAQVPGIKEENVEVTIEGNVLSISANQEVTEEEKKRRKTVYRATRQTSFNYSTSLPRMVDASKAEAEIENGVITITIPKTEEEKKKSIPIKTKKK